MTNEIKSNEKEILKFRYNYLKTMRNNLIDELKETDSDSRLSIEIKGEILGIENELISVKQSLEESSFRNVYLRHLVERLIFGDYNEGRGR